VLDVTVPKVGLQRAGIAQARELKANPGDVKPEPAVRLCGSLSRANWFRGGAERQAVNAPHAYWLRDRRHYRFRSPQRRCMVGRQAAASRTERVLRWVRPRDVWHVYCGLALRIPPGHLKRTVIFSCG